MPDSTKYVDFVSWVNALPSVESPTWLGLPSNAEVMLAIAQTRKVVKDLQQIQEVIDTGGDEDLNTDQADDESAEGQAPAWLRTLSGFVDSWLQALPESFEVVDQSAENPIARFMAREMVFGAKLFNTVKTNLTAVAELCKGTKASALTRSIAMELSKGMVPQQWRKYPSSDFVMAVWLPDLCKRLAQLQNLVSNVDKVATTGVWLGGLFSPEAFVTATRQLTAQKFGWALEQLQLETQFGVSVTSDDGMSYAILDLTAENAAVRDGEVVSSNDLKTQISKTVFKWVQASEVKVQGMALPVYLNSSRKNLLVTLNVKTSEEEMLKYGYQRGVALIAST